jgi:ATP-dependent Lhr-like helicase
LSASSAEPAALLPDRFQQWFAGRGWSPRDHQLALLEKARDDRSALLIAPTGAGKTLAGFLPTLVELSASSPTMRSSPLPPRSGGEGSGVAPQTHGPKLALNLSKHPPPPTPQRELRSSRPHHALRARGEGRR